MNKIPVFLIFTLFTISIISTAYAHTKVEVTPYVIEVGWSTEPPIAGLRNDITIKITEPTDKPGVSNPVTNAFKNLIAVAHYGGITKTLDINSDPRPGYYFTPIIPTKTGTISVELKGDINGVTVNELIPVEDVESTAVLDFPPTSGSSSQDVDALKNALSSIERDVTSLKSQIGGVSLGGNYDTTSAYNFGVFGLSLGAAGVILAIIALIKRK